MFDAYHGSSSPQPELTSTAACPSGCPAGGSASGDAALGEVQGLLLRGGMFLPSRGAGSRRRRVAVMSSAVGEDALGTSVSEGLRGWCPHSREGSSPTRPVLPGAEGFALGQLLPSHRPRSGRGSPPRLTCLLPRRGPEQGGMERRGQAGTVGASVFPCLFAILLAGGSPAGCAGDGGSASHGK